MFQGEKHMKKIAMCGVTLALLVGLAGCGREKAAQQVSHSQATTRVKSKKVTATFENNEIKTPALKLKLTKSKVIPVGEAGNENGTKPVLAIWFSATNLSNNKVTARSAWTAIFAAYQKQASNKQLKFGAVPDAALKDNFNIPKGQTTKGAVAYELVDQQASVTLKAVAAQTVGNKIFDVKTVLAAAASSSAAAESESAAAASSSAQAAADAESAAAASAASDSESDTNAQSSTSADATADGMTGATGENQVTADQQAPTGAAAGASDAY
jgi:hypothetical protein